MTLEQVFYIVGIITMGLMLVLMISLVVAVFIIKSKINRLHHLVDEKVQAVAGVASTAKSLLTRLKR